MNLLQVLLVTCLLSKCFGEDGGGRVWKTVPRRPYLKSDLESTPLEIQTDSRLGDTVYIQVYPVVGEYSIQISNILDSSPIVLLIAPGFPGTLIQNYFNLTGPIHEWKISKDNKYSKFKISCDGIEKIYDFPSSDQDTWKRQVDEIKFMPFDTATSRYRDSTWTWQDLAQVRLPNRLSLYPIEFKTNDASSARQYTHITLYTADFKAETKVDIQWDNDDYQFWIDQCNRCDGGQSYAQTRFTNVPGDIEQTWKLELSPSQLDIHCNGVKVYSYVYNNPQYSNSACIGCTAQMNMQFEYFEFNEANDKAAVEYLTPPQCTGLPESWAGVKMEPELPLPYNSRVSVSCADGYNKTSGDSEVVCLGEENFGFNSQPICRKDCSDDKKDDDKDDNKDHDKDDDKDHDKDDDKDKDDDDDDKQDHGKDGGGSKMLYLGIGLGAGFVVGSLIGLVLYLVKAKCSRSAGRSNAGASYVVKNNKANVYS